MQIIKDIYTFSFLCYRISEHEQTILTLMNTTVTESQSLTESNLNPEFSKTKKLKNIGQKIEKEQEEILSSIQAPPIINEITEKSNETNSLNIESLLLTNSVREEETPEVVVVVRAEQTPIVTDGSDSKVEDSIKVLPTKDEISKICNKMTTTPELSDTDAKARLVGDNRDETAAIVFGEGIASVGSSNPHEDIPSFSEWTQKRLEEAERKKSKYYL